MKFLAPLGLSLAILAPTASFAQQSNQQSAPTVHFPPPMPASPAPATSLDNTKFCYYAGTPYTEGTVLTMGGQPRECVETSPINGPVHLIWQRPTGN